MGTIKNGYVVVDSGCRKCGRLPKWQKNAKKARVIWKDWFFGSSLLNLSVISIPKYYHGKRFRLKIEVIK